MLIKIAALALAVIVGIAAWFVVPAVRESAERTAACQAVVDQARRQIDDPGSATFPACDSREIADPDHVDGFAFRDAYDPKIWHVMGKYAEQYRDDSRVVDFSGDAWRTLDGWEADVFIFTPVP